MVKSKLFNFKLIKLFFYLAYIKMSCGASNMSTSSNMLSSSMMKSLPRPVMRTNFPSTYNLNADTATGKQITRIAQYKALNVTEPLLNMKGGYSGLPPTQNIPFYQFTNEVNYLHNNPPSR